MNRSLLPLCVDGDWFALDAPMVVEVLGRQPWLPIPGAPARSPGVVAWQGRAIAVVNLAEAPATAPSEPRPRERLLVVKVGPSTLAIPADQVREVHEVDEDVLRPPHALRSRYAMAEAEVAGKVMPILDLVELIREITQDLQPGAA